MAIQTRVGKIRAGEWGNEQQRLKLSTVPRYSLAQNKMTTLLSLYLYWSHKNTHRFQHTHFYLDRTLPPAAFWFRKVILSLGKSAIVLGKGFDYDSDIDHRKQ